jgi:hypothetical protein
MKTNVGLKLGVGAIALFISGIVFAQSVKTLYINGKRVSSALLVQDGKVYVPVEDVAKSLDLTMVSKEDGFDLVSADGAKKTAIPKPVSGLSGAVGDTLGNGQVAVQVTQVVRGDRYASAITGKSFDAEPDADLVAVVCRMRNLLKKPRQYDLGYFKGGNTLLTDANGKSFAPKQWDRKEPIARLAAGAGVDFAVIFAVPKGTELAEFVYSVRPNDFDRTMKQDNFHVSPRIKKDTESTTQ